MKKAIKEGFSPEYAVFRWLWLIILFPKAVQLVLLYALLVFLLSRSGLRCLRNPVSVAMLILSGLHLMAIVHNMLFLHSGDDRIPAALSTMLLWPLAAGFYAYYSVRPADMNRIGKACCFNLLVLFLEAVAAVLLYYLTGQDEIRLFGRYLYGWVEYEKDVRLFRFFGFHDYSNMCVLYAMLMYTLATYSLRKTTLLRRGLVTVAFLFPVLCARSRSGLVLAVFSLLMCVFDLIPKRARKGTAILVLGACLAGVIFFYGKISQFVLDKVILGNASSNGLRMEIYENSLREAWTLSPVLGMGIKRWYIPGYPLGSHSTYLGFFYKTGLLGVPVGLFAVLRPNWDVFRNIRKNSYLLSVSFFLLSFVVMLALEDVDGTNWFPAAYFAMLALFARLPGGERGEEGRT